jgi:hypothetical protein
MYQSAKTFRRNLSDRGRNAIKGNHDQIDVPRKGLLKPGHVDESAASIGIIRDVKNVGTPFS